MRGAVTSEFIDWQVGHLMKAWQHVRVRVYLPSTLSALSARIEFDAAGRPADPRAMVADAGATAFAVTPRLREWYREGNLEELEYVALTHAARASLRLFASSVGAPRRVVLAVDVPDHDVVMAPHVDVAAVRVGVAISLEAVAAVHVDDPSASADVEAAAGVLDAAEAGDDDARFILDGLDDHELQWYATQELGALVV
ncbi:MAG TPA: hypothetical protein VN738_10365 [Acidothermaceae bacterium]|nr:hypothetical protein [Acidothermaceae bacterium]